MAAASATVPDVRILDRDPMRIVRAPFEVRHRAALRNLLRVVEPGPEALARYLSQRGGYPWEIGLRTPTGRVRATLYSRHDLLTVNEVFCRGDYGFQAPRLIVDVGANIGLATLFWLSRRPDAKVYCYEPDPVNVERLRRTLRGYEDRYVLAQAAVGAVAGRARFAADGRYGKLSETGELEVEVVALAPEIARIEAAEGRRVDLLKIDTEGSERELVAALGSSRRPEVVWEDNAGLVRREPALH